MPPTTIHSAPALDSFTTLAEHQSQTPTSFYGAKPVLHYHGSGVRVLISQDQASKLPIFTASSDGQRSVGTTAEAGEETTGAAPKIENVDAFISSEYVTALFYLAHL
jgi:nucleotide-sensitive chloride channel 1A